MEEYIVCEQAIYSNILLDTRCYIITFVIIEAVMAAQSSFEFTSVFREEAVVVFWYLVFDGLKIKLDFICLIFTFSDITVGCVCVCGWVGGGRGGATLFLT